jgi:hypothetical protein
LLHRLTTAQQFYLDRVLGLTQELSSLQRLPSSDASPTEGEGVGEVVRDLNRSCLLLCVSYYVGLRVHDPGSISSSLTGQYMQGLALTTLAKGYIDLSSRSTRTTRFTHVLFPVLLTLCIALLH